MSVVPSFEESNRTFLSCRPEEDSERMAVDLLCGTPSFIAMVPGAIM